MTPPALLAWRPIKLGAITAIAWLRPPLGRAIPVASARSTAIAETNLNAELVYSSYAQRYLELGWAVLPVKTGAKAPAIPWKSLQDGVSKEKIVDLIESFPSCNIGAVTGPASKILLVDCDSEEALGILYEKFPSLRDLVTPIAETPRGYHIYLDYPDFAVKNSVGLFGSSSKIDVRGEGGFVVLPPSVINNGSRYGWLPGRDPLENDVRPARATNDFLDFLRNHRAQRSSNGTALLEEKLAGVPEGARNDTAASLAGRYLSRGFKPKEVYLILKVWNESNKPPLPDEEMRKVIQSIQSRDAARNRWSGRKDSGRSQEESARNFEIEKIEKVEADPPIYFVMVFGKKIEMTAAQLASFGKFRTRVMEITNRIIRFKNPKLWPDYLDTALSRRLSTTSVPENAELDRQIVQEIAGFVEQHGSSNSKALRSYTGAYIRDGSAYISPRYFRDLAGTFKVPISRVWEAVRRAGGESKAIRMPIAEDEGPSKVVWAWCLKLDQMEPSGQDAQDLEGSNNLKEGELPL